MLTKNLITSVLLATVAVTLGTVSQASAAPSEQTLAQCIQEFNSQYDSYNLTSRIRDKHTGLCKKVLANQAPTQTLAQCVQDLNSQYDSYNLTSQIRDKHTESCLELLSLQQANIRPSQPNPYLIQPTVSGGSPQAIAACMDSLLYAKNQVCIDPWGNVDKDCFFKNSSSSSTKIVRTRTEVSESTAAQACQNAR